MTRGSRIRTRTPSPDAPRGARLKRILIFSALTLLLAVTQCSFFAALHICPATPDLMLGLVLAILLLDSPASAAAVALGAGCLIDALGTTRLFLSPAFYFLVVLVLALPASKMLSRFPSFFVLALPALVGRAGYTLLCFALFAGPMPAWSYVLGILWREALVTLITILPIYPIVALCMRPIRARNRFHF